MFYMFSPFFIFKNSKFKYKAEILYFYNLSTEKLQIIYIYYKFDKFK